MNEHEQTKYVFAQSAKDLMDKQSLDKMTVTDIVKHSGMTRQTFYRYFQDKYDLVNWYFEKLADKSFRQIGSSSTLREGLIKKFTFLLNDKVFFMQAFQSKDYNNVENYDYQCILEFYTNIIQKKIGEIPPDIMFLLDMYCHGSITMTVDWAIRGMQESPEVLADLFIDALPPKLEKLLSDLQ
ncbi:TetR/AcrR family transcriptional regulator C-terminal domain-containing protein [Candidatus Stoquefichus massiliensis]|uniref:TetR/AcrR family transcriptional regulator C-terminal domain-containing protein n=1 Tax=Candidatus Stoquefichus massiliensis TaxID=1470350 RepID=UPI000480D0EF|nr:TetR/AcrR family transcriptional regulator C-terminal domain-containing protein [Candidatus Stoquefichus massiliensis]